MADSDDEILSLPQKQSGPTVYVQDIEKLRERTVELLDPKWKDTRNRHLLSKMLDLEEPVITAKMVDFLLQDGVCETLIAFVTQVGSTGPRPGPQDAKTDALKLSFKTASLLAPDDPSEALLAFCGKRAGLISRLIFDMFREDSAGSFYHAHRLIDALLRFFPTEVYTGICADGKVTERMGALLRYVGYPPVNDIFVMIVALTPVSRLSPLYAQSSKSRWGFFEQISQWTMLLRVVETCIRPATLCCVDGYISADLHSAAACHLFQELVEKLSLEDTGELLLQPIGYTAPLLDTLLSAATDSAETGETRRNAAKLVCFLLRRCAEPEIMCIVGPAAGGANAQPTCVPNCLFPLRDRVINHLDTKMEDIIEAIVKYVVPAEKIITHNKGPAKYSAYTVAQPFTVLRGLLIELVVLMVESDEMMSSYITVECWQQLIGWTVKYANNNIYHALFYRLLFAVLRQSQEEPQRALFQKAKFASFLIDAFLPYAQGDGISRQHHDGMGAPVICSPVTRGAPEELVNRVMARGLVMNCANAIRLQARSQAPSSFLRQFLSTHQKWNEFLPSLLAATDGQQRFGLGIKVTENRPSHSLSSLSMLMLVTEPSPEDGEGIEHGSRYAKSLGFYDMSEHPGGPGSPGSPYEGGMETRRRDSLHDLTAVGELDLGDEEEEEEEQERRRGGDDSEPDSQTDQVE